MTLLEATYGGGVRLLQAATPLLARLVPRQREQLAARAASTAAFADWARTGRDPGRTLLMVHAASAGELRQAEPVLRRLHSRHPDWQFACTVYSASGLPVARELPVDAFGLLPWDTGAEMAALLDALCPSAIVISKLDLWPVLARSANERGIPLALIAGTVRSGSGRLRWPARSLLRPAYAALGAISAASSGDADRLVQLGADRNRTSVDGDPRADAVLERIAATPPPARDRNLLVAGSTWPADEAVLLDAFTRVRARHPAARLMIAPHRPIFAALESLRHAGLAVGLEPTRFRAQGAESDPLAVVDEVGPLAFLYGQGAIAYVGGGFGRAGLHSVLEPAAWGTPVLVGPAGIENPDARRLSEAGGCVTLPAAGAADRLADQWLRWITDDPMRTRAGNAARRAVESARGAADRATAVVERLVGMSEGPALRRPL
jgi:3-deoxy-D-manno-octulosonic-acid transferase